MKKLLVLFACIAVLLAGCSVQGFADRATPDDVRAEVDAITIAVMDKDFDRVFSNVATELKSQITDEIITGMKGYVKGEAVGDPKLQAFNVTNFHPFNGDPHSNYQFLYEVETVEGFLTLQYELVVRGAGPKLLGLHINHFTESPSAPYRLWGAKITVKHGIMVAAMLAVLGFIIYNLVLCFRSGPGWGKWLWAVLIIIGTHGILYDWSTGEFQNTYIRYWSAADGSYGYIKQTWFINLFGISATKAGGFAPWIMGAYLPIGAIIFWLFRGRKIRRNIRGRRAVTSGQPAEMPDRN